MTIHQFNQNRPELFEANRTQVNINIVEAIKTTIDSEVQGFEYDAVVIENAYMYGDDALELMAKISYAKQYLIDTDFKMTTDYDKDTTAIKIKREEYRTFIRENS